MKNNGEQNDRGQSKKGNCSRPIFLTFCFRFSAPVNTPNSAQPGDRMKIKRCKANHMKIAGWVNGVSYLSQASIGTIAIILASVQDKFPHLGSGVSWNDERASYEIEIPEARLSWINTDGSFEFPEVEPGKYVAMAI